MSKKKREIVYLVVNADKYELPIAVLFSKQELAIWFGKSRKFVDDLLKNRKPHKNCKVVEVDIEERIRLCKVHKNAKNLPPPTTT